jgi:hypothetical protein
MIWFYIGDWDRKSEFVKSETFRMMALNNIRFKYERPKEYQ